MSDPAPKGETIAARLVALRDRDEEMRRHLLKAGRLFEGYCPEMEQVHLENAAELEKIIAEFGYPSVSKVGSEAADAAWLVIQHAISRPEFMRRMLKILQKLPADEIDPRNLARLEDRIRMYEGLPQRYGTQFDWDDDGKLSPVLHDPVAEVDRRRRELGMESLAEATEHFRKNQEFTPDPAFLERHRQGYREWLIRTGWRHRAADGTLK